MISSCQRGNRSRRAFIEFLFQACDFTHRAANAIDSHRRETVLLNRLTAFDHDRWHLHAVTSHLFREVDAERGLDPIGQL